MVLLRSKFLDVHHRLVSEASFPALQVTFGKSKCQYPDINANANSYY